MLHLLLELQFRFSYCDTGCVWFCEVFVVGKEDLVLFFFFFLNQFYVLCII